MRIFTYGETPPKILEQPEQEPINFKAVPMYTGTKERDALPLPDEMLANKDKFPLVEDFEIVLIDGRQNPPEKQFGSDIMALFVDRSKNQRITLWDMYYVDARPMDMQQVPLPANGKLISELELGYLLVMTADVDFIYLAYSQDEEIDPPIYTRYCKIPRDRYESEWKAFIDWYHKHPEKRHPSPTPEERQAHSARNADGSLKKHRN